MQTDPQDPTPLPPTPPKPRRKRKAANDKSPRTLILIWCLFLLGTWGLSLQVDSPASAVRWMTYACLVGMMILWPVYRLSQDGHPSDRHDRQQSGDSRIAPIRILTDWLCLALIFQTVVWPLHMTAEWTFARTWWLIGAISAWTLLTGAVIAFGCLFTTSKARTIATIFCMLLLVGEPIVIALIESVAMPEEGINWPLTISPLGVVSILLNDYYAWTMRPMLQVAFAGVGACLAWGGVLTIHAKMEAAVAQEEKKQSLARRHGGTEDGD